MSRKTVVIAAALAALAAVVVVGLVGWLLFGSGGRVDAERESKSLAKEVSLRLGRLATQLRTKVMLPELSETLARKDAKGLGEIETKLKAVDKRVAGARVLPLDSPLESDYSQFPPLSYAAWEMMKRSEEENIAPEPVLLLSETEQRHLAVMYRIEQGQDLLGHLLLAVTPKSLSPLTKGLAREEIYFELRQGEAMEAPLARGGTKAFNFGLAEAVSPVPGSSWSMHVWTALSGRASGNTTSPMFIVAAVAALALLAFGGVYVSRERKKKKIAQQNAQQLKRASAAAPESGAQPPPPPAAPTATLEDLNAEPGITVREGEQVGSLTAEELGMVTEAIDLPSSMFRAYDVRGVVGEELTPDAAELIARAIGSIAGDAGLQTFIVGCDGRLSSAELAESVCEGLKQAGRDVIDIGRVPTPLLNFATHFLETRTGIMVTGSHNPPEYNGLKIVLDGTSLYDEAITEIRERALSGDLASGNGAYQNMDVSADYIRHVSDDVPVALGNAFKVVIDCGNGVAGEMAPKVIRAIGHEVIELYCEVDGNFPNHHPDPSDPANLQDLIAAVKAEGADIGFAFDGDGDRLGVVDGNGVIQPTDVQMMLLARDVLSRAPGSQIIYDVKSSNRLGQVIRKLGGEPLMWKTGHSFLKAKLLETGAPLAGEMSGHVYLNDRWFGFDDAIYAAARILEILMGFKNKPSDVFAKLPRGESTPEIRLALPASDADPHAIVARLVDNSSFDPQSVTTIDGLRVDLADSWGLVRASNTEPKLVFRFEGNDAAALQRVQAQFKELVQAQVPDLELTF